MTTQPVSAFDRDNPYAGMEVPAQLVTEVINTPAGQRLALALRIPNTTVSVLLVKDDAEKWGDQIRTAVAQMNGLIMPPGVGLG